ncbi:WD repeat-containing protein 62 isoform X2 [Osmerus eperlanus]|uniref:WD repeat-containing protein 62 isoform X2 n=1 Tax=Osmerus eperlanus TaxID=29151 RepID=UPI002E1386AB
MAEGPYGGANISSFPSRNRKVMSNASVATNMRRRSRQSQRRTTHNRVVLERVLGITTSNGSGLACDPNTGLVAYPAGCVIVILHPKKNKQFHILNTSRKTFTALAFSQDGKYLVTGESGHMPCVRVWDVAERTQVAEVQCHKYGVACVAFSTNSSYIVSVGYQHDMTVSVWEWRKGTVIASNKVSSKVQSVSFSEDNSYFVTAGNRHIRFWYLDASKERRVNSTVPLIGRSGLLGEQRNSMFCGLACGRGKMASSTYCITSSGLLCQFNSNRMLDTWVDLKTTSARCLSVSEVYVFCGCADGTVRVFSPQTLHYIATLHRPHCLGVDITQGILPEHLFSAKQEAEYPDTLALTFDPVTRHLTCVYNDHSVYVWDVRDVRNVGKVYSALYHSGCVWSVETYPDMGEPSLACLPAGAFLTCSSDNTIRLWHGDPLQGTAQSSAPGPGCLRNFYSHDLMRIVYVGEDTQHLRAEGGRGEGAGMDGKAGIRVLGVSPDGQHLAAGDRSGNLRIFGLQFMDELQRIEAHDSEVLCLEFSPTDTGISLLASASRDRLIHIFNMEKNYTLEQTVYDHSASITAIKFTGVSPEVRMVSCGADKSIYFRTAEQTPEGLNFSRTHHVVEKTTLYDMDLDATRAHTTIACQDRNIRVYNVKSGKMKKCFKGSTSDEGTLLKVQLDPSGTYLATSCSDKSICIFDYESGECVATLFGHSEIVTGMRFSQDCRHLITVSGDSCVFVWKLDSHMTVSMRKRLAEMKQRAGLKPSAQPATQQQAIRRETFITGPSLLPQEEEEEEEEKGLVEEEEEDPQTPARFDVTYDFPDLDPMVLTNGKLPMWARKLGSAVGTTIPPEVKLGPQQPRGRWADQLDPQALRSVLDTRSLQLALSPSPRRPEGQEDEEEEEEQEDDPYFHPQSLDSLLGGEEEEPEEVDEEEDEKGSSATFGSHPERPDFLALQDSEEMFDPGLSSLERSDFVLYPANSTTLSTSGEGEFDVRDQKQEGRQAWAGEELSPDSACCVGSAGSQDQHQDDTDSLSQVSSTGSSGVEEEEEEEEQRETLLHQHFDTLANNLPSEEKFDTDPGSLQQPAESHFLNPRLSISTRFLSHFQSRVRPGLLPAPRHARLHPRISEEASDQSPSIPQSTPEVDSKLCPEPCATELSEAGNPDSALKRRGCSVKAQGCPRPRPRPLRSRNTIAVIHWRDSLGDITNKTLASQSFSQNTAPVEPLAPPASSGQKVSLAALDKDILSRPCRQSYMGTTASSRAKISQGHAAGEGLNISPTDEQPGEPMEGKSSSIPDLTAQEWKENLSSSAPPPVAPTTTTLPSSLEYSAHASQPHLPSTAPGNHSARAFLHLDLAMPEAQAPSCMSPLSHKTRRRTVDSPRRPALVTPTEMRSLGKEGKKRISSIEQTLTPRRGQQARSLGPTTRTESPARSQSPCGPRRREDEGLRASVPPQSSPTFEPSATPPPGHSMPPSESSEEGSNSGEVTRTFTTCAELNYT